MFNKTYFAAVAAIAVVTISAACNHQSNQKPPPKNYKVVKRGSNDAQADTVCYMNVQGRDTTKVSLHINKGDVSGYMQWLPFEKDMRRGKIAATKQDELISGIWMYMQEGVMDTIPFKFKINKSGLQQQPWIINSKTGKQIPDSKAEFSIIYNAVDCAELKH